MDVEEQAGLLRRAIAHFNAADLDGLVELLHPMAEWPDLMDEKLIWGREAIRDYWERQLVVVVPELTLEDLVPAGGDLVMVATQRALDRRTGEDLLPATTIFQRYTFRDGLIAKMVHFGSLADALAAGDG